MAKFMKRILCLDVGTKRIGVAISDPFGWTAQGLETIARQNAAKDFGKIADLCHSYEVEHVIVGIPLNQEGEVGKEANKINRFQKKLQVFFEEKKMPLLVEGWDERYSTAEAEERLIEMDVSRAKRRKVIDKMAAVIILESYLREHS